MSRRAKLVIGAIGTSFVLVLGFLVSSGFMARGGYFDGGRCMCGHKILIHVKEDGYFTFSPGHGMPEQQHYALRRQEQGWELLALPSAGENWASTTKAGQVVGRIRLEHGALYETWAGSTNSTRHARIYNLWPIWMARVLKQ